MLPKHLPTLFPSSRWTFTKPKLRYKRFASSLPDHSQTKHITFTHNSPSNLQAILEKPTKSKPDIEALHHLLQQQGTNYATAERQAALLLLLKHKRITWVYDILNENLQDTRDTTLFLMTLAIMGKSDEIITILKDLDMKQRSQFLSLAVHDLTESLHRSKAALFLWLVSCRITYSNLKVVHQKNSKGDMAVLLTILNKIQNPDHIFEYARESLTSDEHMANFLHSLSYAYYMLSSPEKIVKVWGFASKGQRTQSLLSNTIQAYSSLKRYDEAVTLFLGNKLLWNDKMLGDLEAAVTALQYRGKANKVLRLQLERNVLSRHKVTRILSTLLHQKRFKDFDMVAEAYDANENKKSSKYHNIMMTRGLQGSDAQFYSSLRSIYSEKKRPTSRTFKLIFSQFAQQGALADAVTLLEVLVQRKRYLSIDIFTSIIKTCETSRTIAPLNKIIKVMESVKIVPDENFNQALLSLHLSFKNFSEVERLFQDSLISTTHVPSLVILMKSFLMQGKFRQAREIYHKLNSSSINDTPSLYLAKLEYFTFQGHFRQAVSVIARMRQRHIPVESRHYRVLMAGYNRFKKYDECLLTFQLALEDGRRLDSSLYREFLVMLVKTGIINNKNFERPVKAVDEVLNKVRGEQLPLRGKLKFKAVKPVINALNKFYDPNEAFRLLEEFRRTDDEFDINSNLNYMKQEMLLFAQTKKWRSFEVVYLNFQEKIKEYLVEDSVAPQKLKKIYNSVIKVIYNYYVVKKDVPQFSQLFQDLLFVHKFTFDSTRLNWVARRLTRRPFTLHDGLRIVENKLMGGYIAKELSRFEKTVNRRSGKPHQPFTYKGKVLKPYMALAHIFEKELNSVLYKHILNQARKSKRSVADVSNQYTMKYPKIMKRVTGLRRRLNRKKKIESGELIVSKKKKSPVEIDV
ncbi:Pentatricopeptide repeat-containing protein MRL1, chloroplastic [Cyberlindnera fabianii]|uniref:Pentatricopeptide repeat-containing protein MRL1, chloroplastic n=1 Tax=Cyberlindnera fabianii TaxID=36022 RepID=A0A1V2L9K5_CYBFA|nr:Pentatricopeptide repeat-containing protein MRL1, chloroplastic [Cyberlindnera fabianii]